MSLQDFVNYRQMGGWLKFFYILNIISIILSAFSLVALVVGGQLSIQMGLVTPANMVYSFVSGAVSLGLSIVLVVLLGKRNPKAVLFFIIVSVAGLLITAGALLFPPTEAAAALAATANPAVQLFTTIFNWAGSIGWFVAWLLYFRRSNRVKVYFMNNEAYNAEYLQRRQQWEQQMAAAQEGQPV